MEENLEEGILSTDENNTDWQNYTNNSTGDISGYSTLHIIISSIILTFMMIVVVVGNMLVIIAIATEKTLKNIQNWFIASLAVADFFVGLLIMPFSLANELMGYWIFGTVWCSIHSAMDVLLCTSSIMNICLISLDRYWSITQAVDYLKKRTPVRAAVMIGMVWALSALISIPPLLGWRDADSLLGSPQMPKPYPKCQLSRQIGYVLYSALGSFYIPSCIMVFVYIRIYFAARARARRGVKKPPRLKKAEPAKPPSRPPSTPTTKAPEPTPLPPQIPSSLKGPNSLESPDPRLPKIVGFQDPLVHEDELVQPEITVESCSPENSAETKGPGRPHEDTEDSEEQRSLESCEAPPPLLPIVHLRETEQPLPKPQKDKGTKKAKRPKLHFLRVEAPTIWRTSSSLSLNGDVHILGNLSRSCSRLQVDPDPISDVEPSSSDSGAVSRCAVVKPLKLRLCQPFFGKRGSESRKARRDVLDMGKMNSPKTKVVEVAPVSPTKVPHQPFDPEREKRRIARKKEKRATLILGLIMGSFILCWLPFFFLYILEPMCTSCQVAPWGFAIAFWLGYMNSALNPVIYTIFNKDFRRAFRRILFK